MQQPVYQPYQQQPMPKRPHRRRGGFGRFVRGYLMTVGAITTIIGLTLLLVQFFVEVEKWIPNLPIG